MMHDLRLAPPYIGATGFVHAADIAALDSALAATVLPVGYRWMAGVLVSHKTIYGDSIANRRYPANGAAVRDVVAALAKRPVFVTVHFNTNPARADSLSVQLERVMAIAPDAQGIQLNIVQPAASELRRFRASYPEVELILQVSRRCLGDSETPDPAAVRAYVDGYAGLVGHALLDLSGGNSRGFDPVWIRAAVASLLGVADVRIGVAGGLGPGRVSSLREVATLGALSIDAEGGLRVPCAVPLPDEPYQDDLDPAKLMAYFAEASAVFDSAADRALAIAARAE